MITDLPDYGYTAFKDFQKGELVRFDGEIYTVREVGMKYVVLVDSTGKDYGMIKKGDVFRIQDSQQESE